MTEIAEPDHREFLYTEIGLELMDLRQDIEFHEQFVEGGYDWREVVRRLADLQNTVADYADVHFPFHPDNGVGGF